jgi:hypothetical protein
MPSARQLEEHIIIVNNDGSGATAQASGGADLKGVVARLLQGEQDTPPADPQDAPAYHGSDRFDMPSGKSKYRFQVRRNEQGQIVSLDVAEL